MCAHRECRDALLSMGVVEAVRALQSGGQAPDPMLQKYITRVLTKLQGGGASGAPPSAAPSIPPSR